MKEPYFVYRPKPKKKKKVGWLFSVWVGRLRVYANSVTGMCEGFVCLAVGCWKAKSKEEDEVGCWHVSFGVLYWFVIFVWHWQEDEMEPFPGLKASTVFALLCFWELPGMGAI